MTTLKQYIPQRIKKAFKYVFFLIQDGMSFLLGTRDSLIPPKRKIFIGDGDFRKIGDEFLKYFINLGNVKPDSKVLDVGCGIGRMALPLTSYLKPGAVYEGIDIVNSGIKWCSKNISMKFPNFRFQLTDIYNKTYNPSGRYRASEYPFPFEENTFDFIYLISVFTHMLPNEVENYIREITRVLKPGKNCLITFFLLNPESLLLINEGKSSKNFIHKGNGFLTINKSEPELAVAYDEDYIKKLLTSNNLEIKSLNYGSWCGREEFLSYQDILVAVKK